eukprot:scaffold581636_cov15-Prasinocladus_malaysianus.AAC.1
MRIGVVLQVIADPVLVLVLIIKRGWYVHRQRARELAAAESNDTVFVLLATSRRTGMTTIRYGVCAGCRKMLRLASL